MEPALSLPKEGLWNEFVVHLLHLVLQILKWQRLENSNSALEELFSRAI